MISKVELLIGGQVVDEQDSTYSTLIAPTLSATSSSKSVAGGLYGGAASDVSTPSASPSVRTGRRRSPSFPSSTTTLSSASPGVPRRRPSRWDVYANYAYLDTQEREVFAGQPQNMLITQVQKAISSGSKMQELNFNHPVKYLASADGTHIAICSRTRTSSSSRSTARTSRTSSLPTPTLPMSPSTTTHRTPPAPPPTPSSFTHSVWTLVSSSPRVPSTSPVSTRLVSSTIRRHATRTSTR